MLVEKLTFYNQRQNLDRRFVRCSRRDGDLETAAVDAAANTPSWRRPASAGRKAHHPAASDLAAEAAADLRPGLADCRRAWRRHRIALGGPAWRPRISAVSAPFRMEADMISLPASISTAKGRCRPGGVSRVGGRPLSTARQHAAVAKWSPMTAARRCAGRLVEMGCAAGDRRRRSSAQGLRTGLAAPRPCRRCSWLI